MRLKTSPSVCAMVRTSSVLAVPGRPVIRQWPPTNSAIITCSRTSCCPTITRCTSVTMSACTWRKRAMRAFKTSGSICADVDMFFPILFLRCAWFIGLRAAQLQQQLLRRPESGGDFHRVDQLVPGVLGLMIQVESAGQIIVRAGQIDGLGRQQRLELADGAGDTILIQPQFAQQPVLLGKHRIDVVPTIEKQG